MIIDTLQNAATYANLQRGFDLAFAFIASDRATSADEGRYDLDGDRVFALVQSYTTKPVEQSVWEAHRKYADVQFIVAGRERMGYAPLTTMTESQAYDAEKDVALYTGEGTLLPFAAGAFAVFMPQDVHMPCVFDGEAGKVRKVVVKVQVDQ
ncbi:YhcH/YjgK/YiaL family protein [Phycisphaerales bacterium AB-hyl4]|uniref:YhcH/YjgK/YiaL family protein n=1 Tax=Natronomicrosphaera hydrolytica TaxID=3242702 RepID=A0ABV4TZW0_9BACT